MGRARRFTLHYLRVSLPDTRVSYVPTVFGTPVMLPNIGRYTGTQKIGRPVKRMAITCVLSSERWV